MGAMVPGVMTEEAADHSARRLEESDWILNAIVGAIAAGKLPPDDAAAWARIAAGEVAVLSQPPALSAAA